MTAAVHSNTPVINSVDCYYLDSFEDSAWLPDGEFVVMHQAYCPVTNRPVGPRGGDPNPAYVRLWMGEHFPNAIEAQIVSVWA
jgi:hypothetical protein